MSSFSTAEQEIIRSYAFAQILSLQLDTDGFSGLGYCPLMLGDNDCLLGHLSNQNLLVDGLVSGSKVKVVFTGPHGYISPRWHIEQPVPTWNYATISVVCTVELIDDFEKKFQALELMSNHFYPRWDFNEFNHEQNKTKVRQMLSAITVFSLNIEEVKSKFKLSQNRSVACRTLLVIKR